MPAKRLSKICATEGCLTQINPRARTNVCAIHKHNTLCNCRSCAIARRNATKYAAEKQPHRRITLVPAPWAQ